MKEFENVGRLIRDKRFTKDQLLDAVDRGDIQLASYAYGFFAWPARKTFGSHLEWYGSSRLCEAEYLSIAPRYYKEFVSDKPIEMGVFRNVANADEYLHVRLKGNPKSEMKPKRSFDELFVDLESLAKLEGKDYRSDSPAHIVALIIRNDMLKNHKEQPEIFPHPNGCGEGKVYKYLAQDNESDDYEINDEFRKVKDVAAKKGLGSLLVRYRHEDVADAVPFTKLMKAFRSFKGQ